MGLFTRDSQIHSLQSFFSDRWNACFKTVCFLLKINATASNILLGKESIIDLKMAQILCLA